VSELLGVIHRVGVFTRHEQNLFVYDDALVLARGSEALMVIGSLGGALGGAVAQSVARRQLQRHGTTLLPNELVERDAANRLWPLREVQAARFRRSLVSPFRRLELVLKDGGRQTFKWQRGENKDKSVLPILRRALGPRLTS
jgi:hypothetical protein